MRLLPALSFFYVVLHYSVAFGFKAELINDSPSGAANETSAYNSFQRDLADASAAYDNAVRSRGEAEDGLNAAELTTANATEWERNSREKANDYVERFARARKTDAEAAEAFIAAATLFRQADGDFVKAHEDVKHATLSLLDAKAAFTRAQTAHCEARVSVKVTETVATTLTTKYGDLNCGQHYESGNPLADREACERMYAEAKAAREQKLPSEKELASMKQQEKNDAEATMNRTQAVFDKANAKLEMLADRLETASRDFDRAYSVVRETGKAVLSLESASSIAKIEASFAANQLSAAKERLKVAQTKLTAAEERTAVAEKALNETMAAISDVEQTALVALKDVCAEALHDCPSNGTCDFLVENWKLGTEHWITSAPPNWREIAGDCPQPSTKATTMASATSNTILLVALVLMMRL